MKTSFTRSSLARKSPTGPREINRSRLNRRLLPLLTTLALGISTAQAQVTGDWEVNANGNWSDPTRWLDGTVPNGVGDIAHIIQNITGTRTITLDVPVTLGTLRMGDTNNSSYFNLTGETLTFDNGGTGALLDHTVGSALGGPSKSPNNNDRFTLEVILNDDLTIHADRNITFYAPWDAQGNDLTIISNARVYFAGTNAASNNGRIANAGTINVQSGELRFDGQAGGTENHVDADLITLGTGAPANPGKAFARLFLVNTEATQDFDLEMNGYSWFINDLGLNDQTLTGDISLTGDAGINIIDLNDPGAQEQHTFTSTISGTGGFTKLNTGAMILLSDNTFEGELRIERGRAANLGSVHLTGTDGALSATSGIVLSRDASLYLDNSTSVNNNRINDSASLTLRDYARFRIIGSSSSAVSETVGALLVDRGTNRITFDLDDATPQDMTLNLASFQRTAGSIAQFQLSDNLPGGLGTTAQVHIADGGASTYQIGGGGANGSTSQSLVIGTFGGVNDIPDHFMTFDKADPTLLRPLDFQTEYLLSENLVENGVPHSLNRTTVQGTDHNLMINFDLQRTGNPDSPVDWYGTRPIQLTESIAVNSLRFGTNTPNDGLNTNELGSTLVIHPNAVIYLGDKAAGDGLPEITTTGSGMLLFGRDAYGTNPGSNQFIIGGALDFGSREAILVNESGNSAFIRSEIRGTGGLTKAGAQTIYLDNANTYTGTTTVAEGILDVRHYQGLGGSDRVDVSGTGSLYLEQGAEISGVDLYIDNLTGSRTVFRSNAGNNTWNGDIIMGNTSQLGQTIYSAYINANSGDTLNLNGTIYGANLSNSPADDINLMDARLISTSSSGTGIININGTFQDTATGAVSSIAGGAENDVLRFQVTGNNELVVNVRNQWDAAGRILMERGIMHYEGEGNFWTDEAAAAIVPTNSMTGFRMGGSSSTNAGSTTFVLTKEGQALNIDRFDIGAATNSNNSNNLGNTVLAGTNTSGTVTFGNGAGILFYANSDAARSHNRDLAVFSAAGGTVNMDFRLDEGSANVHSSFTKIGGGIVNLRGDNTGTNGDIEQVNLAGGLLRLTNYGSSTGTRFDNGAMVIFAGGSLEMDGVGSIANETENFTGTAVGGASTFPAGSESTRIGPGASNVIVTSDAGRTTTLNLGSSDVVLDRRSGGTLNFIENDNGGTAAITLNGLGAPAADTAIAWATVGDAFDAVTQTATALDFAMINADGDVSAFTGSTREDTDNASAWTSGADVSEGTAGFTGTTAAGAAINTLHFDFDGSSTLTIDAGGLTIESGGILVSSTIATPGSTKLITGGDLTAGIGQDLIVHQYGGDAMTIASNIVENDVTALVKTGQGQLVLTGINTYTGGTHINGGTLTISSDEQLGAIPSATDVSNLRLNGGTLGTTADMTLDATRGIMIGGNGGGLTIADGTTLTYGGEITSEPNLVLGYNTAQATGTFVKDGTGTLFLTGTVGNDFTGQLDIREGTVQWEATGLQSGLVPLFGTNNAFIDGTILRSGATLEFSTFTDATNSNRTTTFEEWFTLEGGSTIATSQGQTAATPRDRSYTFNGVMHLDALGQAGTAAGAVTINVGRRAVYLNNDGGYLTGDGGIQKIGSAGVLYFRETNPEWTGQLIVNEGTVSLYTAGTPLGTGSHAVLLGHDGSAIGENPGGNGVAALYIRNEGGFNNLASVDHDIIVRAENGLGNQTKRLGAHYLVHEDVAHYNGSLTLNDDVQFYYQDDTRDSSNTASTAHVRNDTRSYGAPDNSETVFINFNGDISGTGGIFTFVNQGGTANSLNGSITDAMDDLVIYGIFGLNGDNRGWTGDLTISNNGGTNAADDVDRLAFVRLGNEFALNDNLVRFGPRGHLQLGGIDKTFTQNFLYIGATGTATTAKIQNADTEDVTLTFHSDATTVGPVYQDIGVGMEDGVIYGGRYEERGLLNVVKTGAGHTVFGASTGGDDIVDAFSSYTGTTTVQEGILYAGSNNAFSPYSRFIVNDGAELSLFWDEAFTGFDNTIGSLTGGTGALVDIDNAILNIGGDGTTDADFSGLISGLGTLTKVGTGAQRLSGDNTFSSGAVAIIEGTLIGGSNTAFGDVINELYLGGQDLVTVNPVDARVELLLDGTATDVANVIFMNYTDGNDEGITLIGTRADTGAYGFAETSTLDAARDFFFVAEGDATFRFRGEVNDFGDGISLTKIGSGTVELHSANLYGPLASSDAAIDGGTVIRQGTLAIFNEEALSETVIELGDIRNVLADTAYLATDSSLLTLGGEFDPESNGTGGSGTGAFLDVSSSVDGITLTAADVGQRILVKNELGDPGRNGVYEILSVNEADGSMVLVRADDFNESGEMLYGTSVAITGGTQAGLNYFMASADVENVNDLENSPVYWEQESGSPDLALVAGAEDLLIFNDFDVNDTNSGGISAVGGIFTSGNSTFTGNITLQHQDGVDNIHEVTLLSSSDTEALDGERGTIFTGILSEAQFGDTLHVRADGGGTVTLTSGSHSYTGKTTVGADTTLLLHGGADISTSTWLEVGPGGTFDTSQTDAGDYFITTPVSGTGTLHPGSGNAIIIDGGGVIRPGLSSSPYILSTAGDQIGTIAVSGDLVLTGDPGGTDRLVLGMGATGGADFNDAAGFSANSGAGFNSWLVSQGDAYDAFTGGNHDRLTITGDLSLDEGGYIVFDNNGGSDYSPQYGDIFNLLDWTTLTENDFDVGGTTRDGGLFGDLYLPDLFGAGFYNTSLFTTHGIIVVVPEPGRASLLLGGALLILLRRRRSHPAV